MAPAKAWGRHGDHMVRAFDSETSSCQRHCVMFLGKTLFNSHSAPLHPSGHWTLVILMLGVALKCTCIPSRGSRKTPNCFMLQKNSSSLMSHLAYSNKMFLFAGTQFHQRSASLSVLFVITSSESHTQLQRLPTFIITCTLEKIM